MRVDDVALLSAWDADADVAAALGGGAAHWYDWPTELARDVTWRELFIVEDAGRPIGFIQLADAGEEESHYWGDVAPGTWSLDIWIGSPGDRGRGLGTAAMRAALRRAFDDHGADAVVIDPRVDNLRAIGFYERLGFERIGVRDFDGDRCLVMRLERSSTGRATPFSGPAGDDERRITEAVALARRLVDMAAVLDADAPRRRRRRRRRLRTIVRDRRAADFTVHLTDEIPRLADPRRAAARFSRMVARADLSAFSTIDRLSLRIGGLAAPVLPRLVMQLVDRRLRAESADVVLPADDPGLGRHLADRRQAGMRPNLNVLGESIVGDREAQARLDAVLERMNRPDVDYVSVKVSAVCAGLSVLAFDHTTDRIVERLRQLYAAAAACEPIVFVNLDMEEYRDLDLTVASFQRVLDEPRFEHLDAGIVLQAYLPDVYDVAREISERGPLVDAPAGVGARRFDS